MTRPLLIIFAVVLLVLTGMTLWFTRGPEPEALGRLEPASGEPEAAPIPLRQEASAGQVGGAFALVDQNGHAVKDTDFRGKYLLVFFGYTHCPDICPVTLAALSSVMTQLGPKAAQVVPVFITVDPQRDTPAVMKEYLANFNPAIVGLTGTKTEVEKAAGAYKVYAAEPSAHHHHAGEDYPVNHSSIVYFMARDGKYLAHFSASDTEAAMLNVIEAQLK